MLTSKDICRETGFHKTQVSRLVEYGAIEPAEPADGRGKVRRFDDVNLAEFLVAKRLYDLNSDSQAIVPGLRHLHAKTLPSKTHGPNFYTFWEYVRSAEYLQRRRELREEPIFLVASDYYRQWGLWREKEVLRKLERSEGAVVINLAPIVTRVFFP